MKRSNRLMLVVGALLAAVSFVAVLAFSNFGQSGQQPPQNVDVSVVVAAADIPLGSQVTADMLSTATKPQNEAMGAFQSTDDVVGRVARHAVAAGSVLTNEDFDTGVSLPDVISALQPGLRAMAVPMAMVDAVGSLVQPGDYVDVLLSMEELDALNPVVIDDPNASHAGIDGNVPPPYLSLDEFVNNTTVKVVVQNVQVVGTMPAEPVDETDDGANEPVSTDVIVLLAVTPQQAEVVRFAQLDGNISLVLRAPGDRDAGDVATTGITLKELVDNYGVLPPDVVKP